MLTLYCKTLFTMVLMAAKVFRIEVSIEFLASVTVKYFTYYKLGSIYGAVSVVENPMLTYAR